MRCCPDALHMGEMNFSVDLLNGRTCGHRADTNFIEFLLLHGGGETLKDTLSTLQWKNKTAKLRRLVPTTPAMILKKHSRSWVVLRAREKKIHLYKKHIWTNWSCRSILRRGVIFVLVYNSNRWRSFFVADI